MRLILWRLGGWCAAGRIKGPGGVVFAVDMVRDGGGGVLHHYGRFEGQEGETATGPQLRPGDEVELEVRAVGCGWLVGQAERERVASLGPWCSPARSRPSC